MAKAISTPNIAFIKYWGNRNQELRLPANDSLSMTLDSPTVEMTIDHAEEFSLRSFNDQGVERQLRECDVARFQVHLNLVKRYLSLMGIRDAIRDSVAINVRSHVPSGIGLASSAAVFSALAKAYSGLIQERMRLSDQQVSILARLGSGSAARSIFDGYVALLSAGMGNEMKSAHALQVAPQSHWNLHDIVIAPSLQEKHIPSTEGHHLAHTSPHFADRLQEAPRRQQECIAAILNKDFEKLQHIAEEDAWDMHKVAETSTPLIKYLTEDTYRITREITDLRNREHLAVLYTMDAGPTVHLVCTDDAVGAVKDFAHAQKNCTVFETKVGGGARVVEKVTT